MLTPRTVFAALALAVAALVASALPPGGQRVGAATTEASQYVPAGPLRLLDTRVDGGRLRPGVVRTLPLADRAPAGVVAAAVNLIVVDADAAGSLAAYPADGPGPADRPAAPGPGRLPTVSFAAGQTVANRAIVRLGAGGAVSLATDGGGGHVVVDLSGWFVAGPAVGSCRYLVAPATRVADSRSANPVPPGQAVVVGLGGVSALDRVAALDLTVTVDRPTAAGHVTALPWDTAPSAVSTVNVTPGRNASASAAVALGPQRRVGVANGTPEPAHIVVDLHGLFVDAAAATGGGFTPVDPVRLLDTRSQGGPLGPAVRDLRVGGVGGVPARGAAAVVLNVTALGPSAPSWLALWPAGSEEPGTSDVSTAAGVDGTTLVTVPVGADGMVSIHNAAGRVDLTADVVGWYAPGALAQS